MTSVRRQFPTAEAEALLDLTREIANSELRTVADEHEEAGRFPRDAFRLLGKSGLLSLPYPEEHGGGGQPFEVYLQMLEELAAAWLTIGVGVSVHVLSCHPVAMFGTQEQRDRWLGEMLGGDLLGAYCLSERQSGSDAAALETRAAREDAGYRVNGAKAWITHGGVADYYNLMVRTGGPGPGGISCLLADSGTLGLSAAAPERKMGMNGSPTAEILLDDALLPADRLIGDEGEGFRIAMAALDSGRLGIAACAVGLAQAALDSAVDYAKQRRQFGKSIAAFQGLAFLMADMAAKVASGRALYLDAARRKDAGLPFGSQAAIAKLVATDAAMSVTTDAVQILGGAGYCRDFPVERYMREAKVLQIVEGTNQVQRIVIARELLA
ncbi:MAG: acyl-CoA dehydrogenase family protein [Candidatus Nanopelagicales bacterium]|nr:acyl-CoA dehydrogenase family protein [Candidatus Nanopelagicales bacterium]